jgi:tetratricopeptide (TPR) repeat protein
MARYMKAYTLILDGSVQQGTAILEGLSGESKSREVRERSVFLLGRIALEQDDCDRAISFFETYLADYSGGTKVSRVRLHLAACLLRAGKADRVVGVLEPLARKQGEEGLEAALKMGEAYRAMGENDRATEIFAGLTERAVHDSVRARARMETARTMAARGEAGEAVAVLDEAAEIATAKNKGLQDEIVFTKGLVEEQQLQDFDAAILAYDKIGKSQSEYGRMAGKRSAALKAVQEYTRALQDTIPDSPDEEAQYRFMLGETYLDELGLREEAFEQFKTVADSLAETGFGPQAMLRTASMLDAEDGTLAGTYYNKVIDLRPGSVYANFARSRLGLPLVDVVIEKPVVWEEGRVVGPLPPAAQADSLPFVGPVLPSPPEPERASRDTTMHGHRPPPDSLGARRTVPGPAGIRFPQGEPESTGIAEAPDSLGRGAESDTTRSSAPADTTGRGGRWTP